MVQMHIPRYIILCIITARWNFILYEYYNVRIAYLMWPSCGRLWVIEFYVVAADGWAS